MYLFKNKNCAENNNMGGSVALVELAHTWSEMSKTDKRTILNTIKDKARQQKDQSISIDDIYNSNKSTTNSLTYLSSVDDTGNTKK